MRQLAEHVVALSRTTDKAIVPIMTGTAEDRPCIDLFKANNVPFFTSPDQGARGLKALQDRALFGSRRRVPRTVGAGDAGRKASARRSLIAHRAAGRTTL